MRTIIQGGTIVNEGKIFDGTVVIDDSKISKIVKGNTSPEVSDDEVIDASGCFVLPGVIDDHVHFREPGLTEKADIDSESRAAAAGGVTSFFDMPNTVPQTTTLEALEEKFALAAQKSHVNYSFFFGATNDNVSLFDQLDAHRIPGIKLFMGSSTGNMLVDRRESLERIFSSARLPIMAHCEDTDIINRNMAEAKRKYGEDPEVIHHPEIRSEEACYESTRLAVELATKHHARLHIAHLTTARELELLPSSNTHHLTPITFEATVSHLYFSDRDYATLGTRIKCNPAIKTSADRDALRHALTNGLIDVIGTDHAPHLLQEKQGGCKTAASGMPVLPYSLPAMLELSDQGILKPTDIVKLMCHNPAKLFSIKERGYIRKGYKADMTLVSHSSEGWTAGPQNNPSKCGWTPFEGCQFHWKVEKTFINGHTVYDGGLFDETIKGQQVTFLR